MKQQIKNRGNFRNDPNRAREAGRKGGRARGKVTRMPSTNIEDWEITHKPTA